MKQEIEVYHSAGQPWACLAPCSHVGTLDSALARADTKYLKNGRCYLAECRLKIENPLRIVDDEAGNTPVAWLDLARQNCWISGPDLSAISACMNQVDTSVIYKRGGPINYDLEKCQLYLEAIEHHLSRLGFDCFVYDNKVENGGDSYMIFASRQVSIIKWHDLVVDDGKWKFMD